MSDTPVERIFAAIDSGGETLALLVTGGGVATMILSVPLGSRVLRWLGAATALAGGGLYARGRMAERSDRIHQAQEQVHSALDGLDPVAKAQVLSDLKP
jgi:hypothetical protein